MYFVYFLLFVFKFKKISYVLSFPPFPISLKLHALYYVQIVFQLKLYRTNLKFPDPETTDPLPNFYERNFARYRNQIPISKIIFLRNLPSITPFQSPITVKALVKAVPSVRLQSIFEKGALFELHIVEYLSSTTIFYPKRVNLLGFRACFRILGTVKEERLHAKRVASSPPIKKIKQGDT